jgi:hypothetical protein
LYWVGWEGLTPICTDDTDEKQATATANAGVSSPSTRSGAE